MLSTVFLCPVFPSVMTYYEEFCIFLHILVSPAFKPLQARKRRLHLILFIYLYTVGFDSTHTLA